MEVARIASRYGLTDLPYLVRMEREIDELEAKHSSQDENYKDNSYFSNINHFTSQVVISLKRIDHENSGESEKLTLTPSDKKVQEGNSGAQSVGSYINGNSKSVDTDSVDSPSQSYSTNENNNNSMQTRLGSKDVSYDGTSLSYYVQGNVKTVHKSSSAAKINGTYNSQSDDCRNVSAQVDTIDHDHHNSTCNHITVQTDGDNAFDQVKRLCGLSGSPMSLDGDDGTHNMVTDRFVQQQYIGPKHTDALKMVDSLCPVATNRKRRQALLLNDLDIQMPIIEITPLKITKKANVLPSVMNSNSVCYNSSATDSDSADNSVSSYNVESSVDLRTPNNTLGVLHDDSPIYFYREISNMIDTHYTSPVPNLSLVDFLVYPESCEEHLSTSITDDYLIDGQVNKKLAQCTCCNRLHMQRLEEGRYRLGTRIYYLRRFRNHVMVRVGGGWLTLDEFLQRHDPCRRGVLPCAMETSIVSTCVPPIKSSFDVMKPIRRSSDFDSSSVPHVHSVSNLFRQSSDGSSNCSMESPRSESSTVSTVLVTGVSNGGNINSQSSTALNTSKNKQSKVIVTPRLTVPKAPNLRTASRTRDSHRNRDDSIPKLPHTTVSSCSLASPATHMNSTHRTRDSRAVSCSRNPSAKHREDSKSKAPNLKPVSRSRDSSTKR
ncbi:unnamed protein product, partial [Heterobilharzia americana]